jgi:hypothetical protein
VENLKRVKKMVIPWAHDKRSREEKELKQIEAQLDHTSQSVDGGFSTLEAKVSLKALETHHRKLLDDIEFEWHLKSGPSG